MEHGPTMTISRSSRLSSTFLISCRDRAMVAAPLPNGIAVVTWSGDGSRWNPVLGRRCLENAGPVGAGSEVRLAAAID
jgi:hypothetical protein